MRRIGEPWLPDRPYRDRRGVYAMILGRDGHLLLVDERGELQLPGGGIDPGESPWQALHREVREETGWRITDIRHFDAFQRFTFMPDYGYWAHKRQLICLARAVRPLSAPTEDWHQPLWMAPEDAALKLDVAGDRVMVARALQMGLI
ncbi:MAG: NUDIX domain-containing protein [Pseudomonadota bacterium]